MSPGTTKSAAYSKNWWAKEKRIPSTASLAVACSSSRSAIAVVKGPLRRGCAGRHGERGVPLDALFAGTGAARTLSTRSSRSASFRTPASARVAPFGLGAGAAWVKAEAPTWPTWPASSSGGGAASEGRGGLRGMCGRAKPAGWAMNGLFAAGFASRRDGSGSITPVPKVGLGMLTGRGIFIGGKRLWSGGGIALGLGSARPSSLATSRRCRRSSGIP